MILGLTGAGWRGSVASAKLAAWLKGSGKNTAADLIKELVPGAVDIAFADPMKEFCQEVFDFSDEQLWGRSEAREKPDKRYPRNRGEHVWRPNGLCRNCGAAEGYCGLCVSHLTPREALQQLGTEWGRACYPEVWVEYGIRRAQQLLDPPRDEDCPACFGDGPMRGGACAHCINAATPAPLVIVTDCRFQNEADAVRAAGGKVLRITRPGCGGSDSHASEAEAATIEVDYEVTNDDTIDVLRKRLAFALPGLIGVEL